jgi:alpha-glucoside transport system substrate-binding protein
MLCALAAGCTSSGTSQSTPLVQATTTTPNASPSTTLAEPVTPQPVRVLGLWSGPEFDSFVTVKSVWEHDTGGTVDWTGARDLPGELDAQIAAGTPPDIAILPNVALMHKLAAEQRLVPLTTVLNMEQVRKDYAPAWIDLGSHIGEPYGISFKVTDKASIWYNPKAFAAAGYAVPSTWDQMISLADRMVADGRTPFSVVAPTVPGGGGWALTDWISQIVVNSCGPDHYDQWVAGEIAWTDSCIKQSFEMFATIIHTLGYVLGGNEAILSRSDADGSYPLYSNPPTAYMYYMASFAQAFIASKYPQLVPGDDYDTFPFPITDPDARSAVTIGADVVVMLNDTPAARSFMSYLAGATSQQTWINLGGFTSVNRSVALAAYLDPVARAIAERLTAATQVRFSAGDIMPASVQQAWWKAMIELVNNPSILDTVLASLSAAARDARQ